MSSCSPAPPAGPRTATPPTRRCSSSTAPRCASPTPNASSATGSITPTPTAPPDAAADGVGGVGVGDDRRHRRRRRHPHRSRRPRLRRRATPPHRRPTPRRRRRRCRAHRPPTPRRRPHRDGHPLRGHPAPAPVGHDRCSPCSSARTRSATCARRPPVGSSPPAPWSRTSTPPTSRSSSSTTPPPSSRSHPAAPSPAPCVGPSRSTTATANTPSGCDVPAERCDVDHIVPWTDGGRTDQFNGRLECPAHNRHRDLHDTDGVPPPPPRGIAYLDHVRARLRWQLHLEPPDDLDDLAG